MKWFSRHRRHDLKGLLAEWFMLYFGILLFFAAGTAVMPYLRFLVIDMAAASASVLGVTFWGGSFQPGSTV